MTRFIVSVFLTGVLQLYAASYITTSDNENNAHTGTADGDMGAGDCVYNTDAIHPVEFNIDVTGALPQTSAYLAVFIEDVDWPDEVDEVFLNGHSLGYAVGENHLDDSTLFIIPDLTWVQSGNNLVEIYVDRNGTGNWCAKTVSGELVIDEGNGNGPATVTSLSTNATSYDYGDTISYTTELDTATGTQQHVRVEISLRDPNGNIVDFNTDTALKDKVLDGTTVDPYTATFTLPSGGTDGLWSIVTAVYDLNSLKLNHFKTVSFAVPQTAALAPVINDVTPSQLHPGDGVVISGNNFVPGNTVCAIGGTALNNLTIVNTTTVTGNLPSSVSTGNQTLSCTTPNGTAQRSVFIAGFTTTATAVPLSFPAKMLLLFGFGLSGLFVRRRALAAK